MSKEKTFNERFDEEFGDKLPMYFRGEHIPKNLKNFFRQEILKVIDSFEMEFDADPDNYQREETSGYNAAIKETNSRVKELRKEYE